MDITERIASIKKQLDSDYFDKYAQQLPKSTLFPKLEGVAKPPVLTSPSQPKLNTRPVGIVPLPNMRKNGFKPKFTHEMKDTSPYNPR